LPGIIAFVWRGGAHKTKNALLKKFIRKKVGERGIRSAMGRKRRKKTR